MSSKKFALQALAIAALVVSASASHAAVTYYSSAATFASAVAASPAPGVDTFTGFSITGTTPSPITRTAGSFTYTAAASTSTFFGAGTTADPWLSTNLATDTITFSGFSPAVKAIGGNFFGSDINGLFAAGNVTLTVLDSLGATSTQTITGATVGSFGGFTSTGTIVSLILASVPGAAPLWPTADNITLSATLAPIPEPGTYALMFAGLAAVGAMVRRRKA
jgi:hypothetical protein